MATLSEEDKILNQKIARRIKSLRESFEPSQSKFAKDHIVDRQLVSRWENSSDDRGISIHTIHKFCKMIGISLSDFFNDSTF